MRPGFLLSALGIMLLVPAGGSIAETNAWKTREISAGTSVPKGKTSAVKSQRVDPAAPSGQAPARSGGAAVGLSAQLAARHRRWVPPELKVGGRLRSPGL